MYFFKTFLFFLSIATFISVLYSQEIVKVDGAYYVKDISGNLLKIPEGAVQETPKRRPMRSGKYGTPHPSSWHAENAAEAQSAVQPTACPTLNPTPQEQKNSTANPDAKVISPTIIKNNFKSYKCTVYELRGGKKIILSQCVFSMPKQSSSVKSSEVVAKSGESQIIVEIADI